MKKFYETPAVEFTGFNVEDVITTSVVAPIDTASMDDTQAAAFSAAVAGQYSEVINYNNGSYQW